MTHLGKIAKENAKSNLGSAALKADALTTRPTGQSKIGKCFAGIIYMNGPQEDGKDLTERKGGRTEKKNKI